MIKKITALLANFFKNEKEFKKRKYIIIVALIGILFILISNMLQPKKKDAYEMPLSNQQVTEEPALEEVTLIESVKKMEEVYEDDLQSMLNQIQGVAEVEVMVNVDSTNTNVYEKDLILGNQTTDESDKNGGTRKVEDQMKETKLVYIRQGDQEVPILVQTKKPDIRGVFIIAKGAEDNNIKQQIVDAVSKVLDVPTYKISVMPK